MIQEVVLEWDEADLARWVGEAKHAYSRRRGLTRTTADRGKPEDEDGSPAAIEKDVNAAGAEMVVAKYLNLYWPASLKPQPKHVPDVGKTIQVRHTSLPHGCLIVAEADLDEFRFVLVTGEIPRYYIMGYIEGREAKQRRWLRNPHNRGAAYFVPQHALKPMPEVRRAA